MRSFARTAALLVFATAALHAEITIVFDNPVQVASPGDTISFYGVISNTSTDTNINDAIYLNSDTADLTLGAANDSLTDNFANTPPYLAGQQSSGDIDLFDITLSSSTSDVYGPGTYTLIGGADGGNGTASDVLAEATFVIAPEPETWMMMLGGFVLLAARRRLITPPVSPSS